MPPSHTGRSKYGAILQAAHMNPCANDLASKLQMFEKLQGGEAARQIYYFFCWKVNTHPLPSMLVYSSAGKAEQFTAVTHKTPGIISLP